MWTLIFFDFTWENVYILSVLCLILYFLTGNKYFEEKPSRFYFCCFCVRYKNTSCVVYMDWLYNSCSRDSDQTKSTKRQKTNKSFKLVSDLPWTSHGRASPPDEPSVQKNERNFWLFPSTSHLLSKLWENPALFIKPLFCMNKIHFWPSEKPGLIQTSVSHQFYIAVTTPFPVSVVLTLLKVLWRTGICCPWRKELVCMS